MIKKILLKLFNLFNKDKYELTNISIVHNGVTLYRIKALKDFDHIKKGDLGGFIESKNNLSQNGDCWVYDDAKVYDHAYIFENAKIFNNVEVFNNARVFNDARIYSNVKIYNNAKIFGGSRIYGNAAVYDDAEVSGDACVCNYANVFEHACIIDFGKVESKAMVYGNAIVCNYGYVGDNSIVRGRTVIRGTACILQNAIVDSNADYIVFKNWWSSGRYFTWTRTNNMWSVGCFYGTGEELIKKAYEDSEKNGREYERVVNYVNSILKDNII